MDKYDYKGIRKLTRESKLKCEKLSWEYGRILKEIENAASRGETYIRISWENPHFVDLEYLLKMDGYTFHNVWLSGSGGVTWE